MKDFIKINEILNQILSLNNEQLNTFISERCQELEKKSECPSGKTRNKAQDDFLRQHYAIQEQHDLAPIFIKNNVELIKFFSEILKEEKPCDFQGLLQTVQKTVNEYFGECLNAGLRDSVYRDMDLIFLEDGIEPLTIEDFKGQNAAMCFEKTIFSHQLLEFMGIDSIMVSGTCKFDRREEKHVFNIVQIDGKQMVIDFTNENENGDVYILEVEDGKAIDKENSRVYDLTQISNMKLKRK